MKIKRNFILMSILVLGVIGNSIFFSEFAFAGNSELEAKEAAKELREEAKEAAKELREEAKEAAKELREEAKEAAKELREDIKEFDAAKVSNSSESLTISNLETAGKVTICHIPPGNPGNAHTITVGAPAMRAHLAHGDLEGSCDNADLENTDDNNTEKNSRLAEDESIKESKALERAQRLIEKLEQKIASLEDRLQTLIEKYESGEYYGNISTVDDVTNSYSISFEGTATSIYDETVTTAMSGELFLENQVTASNTSKFKIVSGEVIIGNNVYDVAFGKARSSSSGQGESLVILLQTIDSEDNDNTIKINLGFNSLLGGEIENPPTEFEILDKSQVSGQWLIDGSGQLSLEP